MFRSATAAKPALSRRASLVESSEQVKIEAAILAELRKGLYSISEAMLAKEDSDRGAARFDATAAYENVRSLLNHSPFPITELYSGKDAAARISHWQLHFVWLALVKTNPETSVCRDTPFQRQEVRDATRAPNLPTERIAVVG